MDTQRVWEPRRWEDLGHKIWWSCFCGLESDSSENVVRILWSNRSSRPACLTQGDECPLLCSAVVGAQPSQVEAEVAAGLRVGMSGSGRGQWLAGESGTDQFQRSCLRSRIQGPNSVSPPLLPPAGMYFQRPTTSKSGQSCFSGHLPPRSFCTLLKSSWDVKGWSLLFT